MTSRRSSQKVRYKRRVELFAISVRHDNQFRAVLDNALPRWRNNRKELNTIPLSAWHEGTTEQIGPWRPYNAQSNSNEQILNESNAQLAS